MVKITSNTELLHIYSEILQGKKNVKLCRYNINGGIKLREKVFQ